MLDNHRPIHLKNIYSRHNVVIFDDTLLDADDEQDVPSEASEMSSVAADESSLDSDSTPSDNDDEEEDEEDEFEMDFDNKDREREEEEEMEFDGDDQADEVEDGAEDNEEAEEEEKEDNHQNDKMKTTEAADSPEAENQQAGDMDQTFVASYDNDNGGNENQNDVTRDDLQPPGRDNEEDNDDDDEEEEGELLSEQENDEENMSGSSSQREQEEQQEEEDEGSFRITNTKKRKLLFSDPIKAKRSKIRNYYLKVPFYSSPTSILLFRHVSQRFAANGQMPLDVSWQAILGVTDCYLKGRIDEVSELMMLISMDFILMNLFELCDCVCVVKFSICSTVLAVLH